MDQDDDFGLSSGDEADLAALCDDIEASPISTKRKHSTEDDSIEPPAKRLASNRNYSTKSPLAVKILNEQFGLEKFRLEQEAVIARIMEGGSAVVVFPTGGGKSLCYQVNYCISFNP
jgi:superfamily II DNA helicase RecQ